PDLMPVLVEGGVNRLSMGAQSFQPDLLKALERWHDPASVGRAVDLARAAGIANINLDLIFAVPGQSMAQLDADLDALLALEPEHVSCYSLIFEPGTPLTVKMQQGKVRPAREDLERDMFERVIDRLGEAGFEHYEVSNWARRPADTPAGTPADAPSPDRCEHNLIYWRSENWLGLGPSAASHRNGQRWKNLAHLGRYLAEAPHPPREEDEALEPARQVGERLMMGLRVREGVPLGWLEDALPPDDPRWRLIDEFTGHGLIERTDTHLRLTRRGLFLTDAVAEQLL
ncbi:MAG: coproporphyrinogen-III oxidase family protein, partial [Phycisphaeraceae bacterium]